MKVYREDDWKAEVEVVKDESDSEWDKFTLKVIKTLLESKMYQPTRDGTVFEVTQLKGVTYGGMWTLRDE